jgi:hypothetical protein
MENLQHLRSEMIPAMIPVPSPDSCGTGSRRQHEIRFMVHKNNCLRHLPVCAITEYS